jgi:hypothetical protein
MGQTKDRRRVYGTVGRRNGPVYSMKAFSLGIAIHCTASRIGLGQTWVGRSLWLDSCDGTEYVSILTSLLKRELGVVRTPVVLLFIATTSATIEDCSHPPYPCVVQAASSCES